MAVADRLLVVIDYQKDFVDGALGSPQAAGIEQQLAQKIRQYRQEGQAVVFTLDTHGPDYLQTQEGQKLPVPHCIKGTPGWALYGQVGALCDGSTPCFEKEVFGSVALGEYVRAGGFSQVELCGVVTDICVLSNAAVVRAFSPESRLVVDAGCVATGNAAMGEKALDLLENLQVEVTGHR